MKKLPAAFLIAAAIGVGIAVYTAYEYITGQFSSACTISSSISCAGVAASGHTSLFGIPFWSTGLVWFPLLLVLGLVTSKFGARAVNSEILLPILMIGNSFTIYLWYLELAVIHIICPFCVSLYIVNYFLTGVVFVELFKSGSDLGETTAAVEQEEGSGMSAGSLGPT
jgi:uncharacterized membrane protein